MPVSKISLTKSDRSVAPAWDEMEVSIFGPGKGEAIAVHLGGGDWVTVDSCRDQSSGSHALLNYFLEIGVDVSTAVKLVVGTHAHDDHIAGISELYAAATGAAYVGSPALTSEEFLHDIEADAEIEDQLRQGVRSEFDAIWTEVEQRRLLPDGRRPFMNSTPQRKLWSRTGTPGLSAARVIALSPSDLSVKRANSNLARGLAKASERRRLSAGDPNEYAVALWIEVGDTAILLGADLTIGPDGCGWGAVLETHKPNFKASLHKVPHHGSPTAHHDAVWSEYLTDGVVSVLAPYRGGVTPNQMTRTLPEF